MLRIRSELDTSYGGKNHRGRDSIHESVWPAITGVGALFTNSTTASPPSRPAHSARLIFAFGGRPSIAAATRSFCMKEPR